MHAMPGLRGFLLRAQRSRSSISCSEDGAFVGDVPLLTRSQAVGRASWNARPVGELNDDLTGLYRLPVDATAKLNAIALVAAAFNRGDLATAAIATVQMQFPNPPVLKGGLENPGEIAHLAEELSRSGLLKVWDPAQHPRTGTKPNPGWFAPIEHAPVHVAMEPGADPETEPDDEGDRHESPFGSLKPGHAHELRPTLPFPSGLPLLAPPNESPGNAPRSGAASSTPWIPPEPTPALPFPGGLATQFAPYVPGSRTYGVFTSPGLAVVLQSGEDGPAASMPTGSLGFDGVTRLHVEGHAAAFMLQNELSEGTLYINNAEICDSCSSLLPRMLPAGAILNVVFPNGTARRFVGTDR
jgi:hypothetical protein